MGQVVPARAKLSQQQMVAIQRLRFCLAFAEAETSCVQIESPPIRMVHPWMAWQQNTTQFFLRIVVYVIPNKNMNVSPLVLIAVQKIVL